MKALDEFIVEKQYEFSHAIGELTTLLSATKLGTKTIHRDINKTGLVDILGVSGTENMQDEVQQKFSLFTSEKLKAALKACDIVAGIAPEEEDEIVVPRDCERAKHVVLMNPPDGSSNIDVNVSVGTIFSIYRRVMLAGTPITEEDFLQSGNKQVMTDYVIYDSSIMLARTTGCGVHAFTYGPSPGVFCLCQEWMHSLEKGKTYFANEGNYIKFPSGVKGYTKFCQEEDKFANHSHTSRYIGSLAMDSHRNLLKGGIYFHPSIASHPDGRLRSLYECNPMVFLAEQASGKASDGKERILDIIPETLHQRRSFFVGNDRVVEDVGHFIREFPNT